MNYRQWYLQIGAGKGVREIDFPIAMTKRMGQHFLKAPKDVSIVQAVRWLIDQPLLDQVHVVPILDYLHNQRFVPERVFGLAQELDPPEPNLTMRGRAATSLLRQVKRWQPCGIPGFELPEGKESSEKFRIWSIRELLGAKSLILEGRKLGHCVATYSRSCASGATTIWTLAGQRRIVGWVKRRQP